MTSIDSEAARLLGHCPLVNRWTVLRQARPQPPWIRLLSHTTYTIILVEVEAKVRREAAHLAHARSGARDWRTAVG